MLDSPEGTLVKLFFWLQFEGVETPYLLSMNSSENYECIIINIDIIIVVVVITTKAITLFVIRWFQRLWFSNDGGGVLRYSGKCSIWS